MSVCACQLQTCPHDNSLPVAARITKFVPEVQNTLVKIPIVLGVVELDPKGEIQLKSTIFIMSDTHFYLLGVGGTYLQSAAYF